MQAIQEGYRGLAVLLAVHWDRLYYGLAIICALFLGSFFGSLIIELMTHPAFH
ncbi:hypothetical protein [Marivita sp. GX14005]|uniref:hypothetical protein n=1 Tax=Marivita sp. GX14005 TaxID=2942276 RepID=UPI0020198500|nr:hypothetical protein [Marivita sp. GX14005]MCL3880683.1 hypothetical protein [Marivita sp. GX14005]